MNKTKTIYVGDLPEKIKSYVLGEFGDSELTEVNEISSEELIFSCGEQKYVIIPNHEHDLSESNITLVKKINLKKVRKISLLGGPCCKIYVKKDESKDAWMLFEHFDDMDAFSVARF